MVVSYKPAVCFGSIRMRLRARSGAMVFIAVLLLPPRHGVAQVDQDSLLRVISPEDTEEVRQREDDHWQTQTMWQLRYVGSSEDLPLTYLGGSSRWQLRGSIRHHFWRVSWIADKGKGEPWGLHSKPWTGPEMKRVSVERKDARFTFLGGGFSISHGWGLHAGRRMPALSSRSGALSIPGRLARVSSYAGTTGAPVRSGALFGVSGSHSGVWIWTARSRVAASTSSDPDEEDARLVRDISHTTTFATANSLMRRRLLNLSNTGVMMAGRTGAFKASMIVEHTTAETRPGESAVALTSEIPRSLFAGSMSLGLARGAWSAANEVTLPHQGSIDARWAIRWRLRNGSGIVVDRTSLKRSTSSPYSHRGLYQSKYRSETVTRLNGKWLVSGGHSVLVRSTIRNRRTDSISRASQVALDWIAVTRGQRRPRTLGPVGRDPLFTVGLRFRSTVTPGGDRDSQNRLIARRWIRLFAQWKGDVQIQTGYRLKGAVGESGSRGLTVLGALTAHRALMGGDADPIIKWPSLTYSAVILIRRHNGARTTLYAGFPVVTGSFPVIAGSSNKVSLGQRLRYRGRHGTVAETTLKIETLDDPGRRSLRATWAIQIRVPLGG